MNACAEGHVVVRLTREIELLGLFVCAGSTLAATNMAMI